MKKIYCLLMAVLSIAVVACTGPNTNNPDDPNTPGVTPNDTTVEVEVVPPPYYVGAWESGQMTDTMYVDLSLLESAGMPLPPEMAPYLAMLGDNVNIAIMPAVSVWARLNPEGDAKIASNVAMNMAFHIAGNAAMPEQYIPLPIAAMDTTITEECRYKMTETQLILIQEGDTAQQNVMKLDVVKVSDTEVEISLSDETAQQILATIPTEGGNPMEDAVMKQMEVIMSSIRFKMTKKD